MVRVVGVRGRVFGRVGGSVVYRGTRDRSWFLGVDTVSNVALKSVKRVTSVRDVVENNKYDLG